MALAHQALATGDPGDEAMRDLIRRDINAVIQMLVDNQWHITDQNGERTGNNAHWVGPGKRLGWLILAAAVNGDDPYYRDLLDRQYRIWIRVVPVDLFAGFNKYDEYFGNNLRHLDLAGIFRYWPDRRRLQEWWGMHQDVNRPYVENTHNAWYDAVHVAGCRRLGVCDEAEFDALAADVSAGLSEFPGPPDTRVGVVPPELPLDPFSVFMSDLLDRYPDLREIIDIHPQTAVAHRVGDRCWDDMIWQRSPFSVSCSLHEDPTFAKGGFDYLVAYWMAVYYGLVPGPGPIGDAPLDGDGSDAPAYDGDDDSPDPTDDGAAGNDRSNGTSAGDDAGCG
jgi:hypothetical protein